MRQSNNYVDSGTFGELIAALDAAGFAAQSDELLDEAIQVALESPDSYWRPRILYHMAICLARKGRLERARSVIAEADAASVPKIYAEQSEALGEIALSLAKSGQRQAAQAAFAQSWESTSRMAIYGIQERETRADAMYQLASLLCKAGYTEEAQRATFSIEYGSNNEAVHRLATALIQSGKYADALQIVGTDLFQQFSGIEPDGLPGMLAEWSVFFERVRPGLSLSILQEVTRVMGWVFEDWQEAYQVLADASA